METIEVMKEIEGIKITGDLNNKRFACGRCGSTWNELVGLIVGEKEWFEDLCFHTGIESDKC